MTQMTQMTQTTHNSSIRSQLRKPQYKGDCLFFMFHVTICRIDCRVCYRRGWVSYT